MGWVRCAEIVDGYQKKYFGTLVPDTYIDRNTGAEVYYASWSATDYLEVVGGTDTVLCDVSASNNGNIYNAFYDENKNFVSSFDMYSKPIIIPQNARYMRISTQTFNISPTSYYYAYTNKSATDLIPLDLTNEVHNIQNNRTITISRNTIVSPISSHTNCIGVIAIPLDLSDGSNTIVIKYGLQGYSASDTVYYSTMFFDDNNTVSNVTQKTGVYPYRYKQLYQVDIASGGDDDLGHIDCLGVLPNISGTLYLKINLGTTNYKSLSLFKTKL